MKATISTIASTLALFAATSSQAAVIGGPILNPANNHFYLLLSQNTWTASEAEALTLGSHLATINNAAEDSWVFDTFSTFGGVNRQLWIGLNDLAQAGNFQWTSGEPVTYTHWAVGEPNFIGDERYVYIVGPGVPPAPREWNNYYNASDFPPWGASGGFFGVVETPEPSAALLLLSGSLFFFQRRSLRTNERNA